MMYIILFLNILLFQYMNYELKFVVSDFNSSDIMNLILKLQQYQ